MNSKLTRVVHYSMFSLVCSLLTMVATVAVGAAEAPKGEPTNAAEAAARKAQAEAEIEAKYQALVAKLPPEQQAWERVLQDQLGGFYLPLHKRARVAGQSTAWDFVQDDPQLPRVLLIGDSVSRGYTQAVRKALAGKANVHRAPANCGPTASGLKNIDVWLGDGQWDVIHFNFGIHDRGTPLADYTQRLEQLIQRMQKTGAKLIWASTTPIPDDPGRNQTAASIGRRRTHGPARHRRRRSVQRRHAAPGRDAESGRRTLQRQGLRVSRPDRGGGDRAGVEIGAADLAHAPPTVVRGSSNRDPTRSAVAAGGQSIPLPALRVDRG
ncbi:MAG: SGNH/GDSL hydrolase family protein [Pirellulaceae bacterium]|nr:SGNH/GDSL hydrolase family protein [Pirellulaceae bacterium]